MSPPSSSVARGVMRRSPPSSGVPCQLRSRPHQQSSPRCDRMVALDGIRIAVSGRVRILSVRALNGPNVHHHEPVLVATLDLEQLAQTTSTDHPSFVDRLLRTLPGLRTHHCGVGYEGGFVDRLREGTYFGHLVEHIALELSDAAGIGVTYGKTRETATPGVYSVVVRSRCEPAMHHLLHTAVDLVESLLADTPFALEARLDDVRRLVRRAELGPSTAAI